MDTRRISSSVNEAARILSGISLRLSTMCAAWVSANMARHRSVTPGTNASCSSITNVQLANAGTIRSQNNAPSYPSQSLMISELSFRYRASQDGSHHDSIETFAVPLAVHISATALRAHQSTSNATTFVAGN